jgi:hypothetical protein
VSRIVRYLVANRLVGEVAPDQYVARKATYTFASPGIESPMRFFHAISNPAFQVLPDFLKDTGYQNQVQACAVQKGLDTNLGLFPWLKQHPSLLKDFQNLMGVPREGPGSGIDAIALDVTTAGANDSPVLVDIGGNVGQQARRVLARYPELAGRLLVQDRDETIKSASDAKGIRFMAHDFFAPQPVKGRSLNLTSDPTLTDMCKPTGAKYYYLRAVLHNWDDDKAAQILANIVPAMSAGSRVLIDEVIIPDMGAHIWPAGLDLQMFTLFGSFERTASQWDALLQRAGLRPVAVEKYAPVMGGSVIFAAPR